LLTVPLLLRLHYEVAEGAQVRIHLWASRSGSTTDHRYSRVGVA
jgi:hypothetical protein